MRKYQDPDYYDEPEWDEDEEEGDVPPKKHHTLLLVLAIILVPICAMFFGYESADQKAKADEIAKTTFAGRLASEAHQAQLPIGGSQLIFYYPIDQMTTEDLNDWYFNIIQKQMYYSGVILDDKDSTLGIYANAKTQTVYVGVELNKKDNESYGAIISSAQNTLKEDNGTLKKTGENTLATDDVAKNDEAKGCIVMVHPAVTHVVHHEAVTHQEKVSSSSNGTSYKCSSCGELFPSYNAWLAHIRESHGGYGYYTIVRGTDSNNAGKTITVTDTPAWDETVIDKEAYDVRICSSRQSGK